MIDFERPIITRDGRKARVLCTDLHGKKPVAIAVRNSREEYVDAYYLNGSTHNQIGIPPDSICVTDLFNLGEGRDAELERENEKLRQIIKSAEDKLKIPKNLRKES